MRIDFSKTERPEAPPERRLTCVYHVEADGSYCGVKGVSRRRTGFAAVRTLAGCGRMELDGRRSFELPAGTLFLAEAWRLVRYAPKGGAWHFWWFEFEGGCPLPWETLIPVAGSPEENALFRLALEELRAGRPGREADASAVFGALAALWQDAADREEPDAGMRGVDGLLREMRCHPERAYPLPEAAARCALSMRRFRDLFCSRAGLPPKAFLTRARMERARELLTYTSLPVAAVAENCGYSDGLYFSRVFRRETGLPPRAYRLSDGADGAADLGIPHKKGQKNS